jgi:hypothetical protein
MTKPAVLPGFLGGARRGQDDSALPGHLREGLLGRPKIAAGADVGHEDLGSHAAREATVKDAEQPAGRDRGEALGQLFESEPGLVEVVGVSVMPDQVMTRRPMPGEVHDHDVVGIACLEIKERAPDVLGRRCLVDQKKRAIAQRVSKEGVQGHSVTTCT